MAGRSKRPQRRLIDVLLRKRPAGEDGDRLAIFFQRLLRPLPLRAQQVHALAVKGLYARERVEIVVARYGIHGNTGRGELLQALEQGPDRLKVAVLPVDQIARQHHRVNRLANSGLHARLPDALHGEGLVRRHAGRPAAQMNVAGAEQADGSHGESG